MENFKKQFLRISTVVILLTSLVCCSSDNSSANSNNSTSIHPPSWIQGTWLLSGGVIDSGFKFTSNDFCVVSMNLNSCYKEQLNMMNGTTFSTNIKEEISSDSYSIEITLGPTVITYEFEKISETEIAWSNSTVGDALYEKQ